MTSLSFTITVYIFGDKFQIKSLMELLDEMEYNEEDEPTSGEEEEDEEEDTGGGWGVEHECR